MSGPKAVVLLSGGMDSTTVAAIALSRGFDAHALTFRYGQRHKVEVEAARRVADRLGIRRHVVLDIDLRAFGGSALTGDLELPKDTPIDEIGHRIPSTYVPARNTIFLAFALGWSEVLGAFDIFLGANALDYSGYPDCRPEFYRAAMETLRLGSKLGTEYDVPIHVVTPLIELSKAEIVRLALRIGAPLQLTWSCYSAGPSPCGRCDSCLLRAKGFAEAGASDPALAS
jgi:7-cyano-7-deazaguanine synthase